MISVIISAYKGELYIEQAIRSVLCQLPYDGEIIVCDEKPGGATERIIKRLAAEDSRIIPVEGKNTGATENMINAIRYSKGDKIFICSQNDVWLPDKIKRVNEAFSQGADLVLHNAYITDENLNITDYSFFEAASVRKGIISNISRNSYIGSLMAFDRRMLRFIMPIPKHIPDCDQWIGLICRIFGTVRLVDAPLSYRRQLHTDNDNSQDKAKRRYLINKLYKRVITRR